MSSEQKTEKPTPRRLREARKKGQASFSRDANGVVIYLVGILAVFALGGGLLELFRRSWTDLVAVTAQDHLGVDVLQAFLVEALRAVPTLLAPMLLAVLVAGVVAGFAQTQGLFSFHPLKPELKKLSPMKRLKQIFSARGLMEFLKTLLKLAAIVVVAYLAIWSAMAVILRLGLAGPPEIFQVVGSVAQGFLIGVGVVFFCLGAVDLLFQRWQFQRDQRMGKHEVKREHKDTEGDPLIKNQRRVLQAEMTQQDLSRAIQAADAVVVNPTHLAVALLYDKERVPAPLVTVKGRDRVAQRIKDFARRHGTPVVRDVPLARALFETEEGDLVPRDLYAAVAEVLMFVYRLRRSTA
ncbi:MAG: EscU/YscU/HrcU family type III secretion system export apparatus switch protein [Acidobacteriota bacterium]